MHRSANFRHLFAVSLVQIACRTGMTVGALVTLTCTSTHGGWFQPLISPHEGYIVRAGAISVEGQTVAGSLFMGGVTQATNQPYLWTRQDGFVPLQFPVGQDAAEAFEISRDGGVVVGQAITNGTENTLSVIRPTVWNEKGQVSLLPIHGNATDVSGDGRVVIGTRYEGNQPGTLDYLRAYSWTADRGPRDLGALVRGGWSLARCVSGDGSVIWGTAKSALIDTSDGEVYRWTEATGMVGMGFGAGMGDTSWDGNFVVGSHDGHPTYWTTDEGFVNISTERGSADAVTADGDVIVGSYLVEGSFTNRRGFYWSSALGFRDLSEYLSIDRGLELNGWVLRSATDVSADGLTIIGGARHIDNWNQFEFFTAYLGVGQTLGDTDDDGDVDLEDLNHVRNNFGGTGLGDTEGNGTVDLADLNNVRNHFGETASGAASVPEPSSAALAFIMVLAVVMCAWRRWGSPRVDSPAGPTHRF